MAITAARVLRITERISDIKGVLDTIEGLVTNGEHVPDCELQEVLEVLSSLRHNVERYNKERLEP